MTKLFCDRCKTEIKNRNTAHKFDFQNSWEGDLCEDCYKAFESFMKMEDSMYHANPVNHHGIERMTIGSR